MFTDKIETIISNGVSTIGGKDLIPKGIYTVSWSFNDDEVKLHTNKFNRVPYFLYSPVKIISATSLAEYINYYEVTWVPTKSKYSILTWNFWKYKRIIAHSENCLP